MILRHAQSQWNALGRWQGQADPYLSPEGIRQATEAAPRLAAKASFEVAFSSDLSRARETAEIFVAALGGGFLLEIVPGLREYDVGEWSGRTRPEIESLWPGDIQRFAAGELAAPPGGEDRGAFDTRVLTTTGRIAAGATAAGQSSLLVVAHGGVVRSLARSAGVAEHHVGHLSGYTGRIEADALIPEQPVDLLDVEFAGGSS